MKTLRCFGFLALGFFLACVAALVIPRREFVGDDARWLPILVLFAAIAALALATAAWIGFKVLFMIWAVFRELCPDTSERFVRWARRWTMTGTDTAPDFREVTPQDPLDGDAFDTAVLRGGLLGRFRVVDALLKARGALIREVRSGGDPADHIFNLMMVVAVFGAVYGAILGIFGGGWQVAYAAAKVPLILLGTTILCLPTFYVFNSILGSRLTLGQTMMLILLMTAAVAILLIGFAPIAWFFTVSTGGPEFMTVFHLVVFGIGLCFGVSWINVARRYLRRLEGLQGSVPAGFFALWVGLYTVVGCQMAYYLRPILDSGPFCTGERGLFLEFLGNLLKG